MKIGRNDPCPCGSGKKYKKCCLDELQSVKITNKIEEVDSINPFFKQYNSFDLLQSIAGLSIIPKNHGKYVRLEQLATKIIQNYNINIEKVTIENLKSFLDEEYSSNQLEDSPVNQFTDLVTFYGGDYLIFPGITENGSFILSNLLAGLFHWPNSNIPKELRSNCQQVTMLLLNISNIIAKRLGYSRYQDGEVESSQIYIPDSRLLTYSKSSVTFSEKEMNMILRENFISKQALNEFLIDVNSTDFNNPYIEESPLLLKPILFKDGNYLIVSPATLSFALTNYIWSEAERMGCMKEVNDAYHNIIWNNLQFQLNHIGFKIINQEDILFKTEISFKEGIYRFDDDKIAYIQLIFDSGNHFKNDNYNSSDEVHLQSKTIEIHKDKILSKLFKSKQLNGYQILNFTLFSAIGRDYFFTLGEKSNCQNISMPVFEFDVLCNLKEVDAIDFWKFSIARKSHMLETFVLSFSFLDLYKIYKDNDDSFYLSDETKYSYINIEPGYSAKLIRDVKLLTDKHSVLRDIEGRLANVSVELKDKYYPVYVDLVGITSAKLEFVVEGFHQPIWVSPVPEKNNNSSHTQMLWETNDAIAYWLWQIQSDIKEDLKLLGTNPITAYFDLVPTEKFEILDRNIKREPNLFDKFQVSSNGKTFTLIIPSEILPYLYGSDNEGERILVKNILKAINLLLCQNNLPEISKSRICNIIDSKVPLGMKKKFFILDTNDNLLLDPRNLVKHRYVQRYDTSIVLNAIVPALGKFCPPIGEITEQKDKNDLTYNIIQKALFPLLRKTINQYDSTELLKLLIELNETLIRKREELRILTPTRIACFGSIEQQKIDLQEDLGNVNRSTLPLRCLIEHIAAEPSLGKKIISTTDIDEIVAIMDQIISWGSLGDQIHYDLLDIKMWILPTGRVGTDKTLINEIFNPYYSSKTSENIEDSINKFDQVFPQNKNIQVKEVPANLDKAFTADYGISFSRICQFIEGLSYIGFLEPTSFAAFPLKDLRNEVNKHVANFDINEFEKAILYLSLSNRGGVDKLTTGYEFIDIMPWRFNRMLSLLRKPLVIVDSITTDVNDKIVFWGARQVLSSRIYLSEQCQTDRLRVFEGGQVKKALGQFAQKRGDALVNSVLKSIDPKDLIIHRDVYIGPKYSLKNEIDIGDIDILIIDIQNKTLFSLECKSMSPSRNIKEMIEEVEKLFGSKSEMGWIDKHLRRHTWIESSKGQISAKYKVDISDFSIKSFIITAEDMLTPYLRKHTLQIPFITSYEIEKEGISKLRKE